jgi:hypothetical protein
MTHKRRTLKSALVSSARQLRISKDRARKLFENIKHSDERVFKLEPRALLEISERLEKSLST